MLIGRRRKAVATIGSGPHEELLDITRRARRRYAGRHGYRVVERTGHSEDGLPPAWAKIPLVRELLDRYELVLWIDADAVPVDFATDVAAELAGAELGLVVHRFHDADVPNTGLMVVRSTTWSRRFFDEVWAARHEYAEHKWWDNAAVLHLLGYRTDEPVRRVSVPDHAAHVTALPYRWNAIPQLGGQRPAVVHLPGCPHRYRLDVLRRLAHDPAAADAVLAAGPPAPDYGMD